MGDQGNKENSEEECLVDEESNKEKGGTDRRCDSSSSVNSWKNEKGRVKGEMLVSKLKLEVQFLERQVEFMKQEKIVYQLRSDNRLEKTQTDHAAEITMHRDKAERELTAREIEYEAEKSRMVRGLSEQMKLVEDSLRYEEAAITQGSIRSMEPHEMEAELITLRQTNKVQKGRIEQVENANNSFEALIGDLQSQLKVVEKAVEAANSVRIEATREGDKEFSFFSQESLQREIEELKHENARLKEGSASVSHMAITFEKMVALEDLSKEDLQNKCVNQELEIEKLKAQISQKATTESPSKCIQLNVKEGKGIKQLCSPISSPFRHTSVKSADRRRSTGSPFAMSNSTRLGI